MSAKPLRTKPKRASAERCLRALGATMAIGNPSREPHIVQVRGYFRIDVYERPVQLSLGSLGLEAQRELLASEQRRPWERKPGHRRPQGLAQGKLRSATAIIWEGVAAAAHAAKEGSGGERLASFGSNTRCGPSPS